MILTSNRLGLIIFIIVICTSFSACCGDCDDIEEEIFLEGGLYLGQDPPGMTPESFAPPELRANENWYWYGSPTFTPDLKEMYFTKYNSDNTLELNFTQYSNGGWTSPRRPDFSDSNSENSPTFSSDGNTVYFLSRMSDGRIRKSVRNGDSWFRSIPLQLVDPSGFNIGWQIFLVDDNVLYYELGDDARNNIYRSEINGFQLGTPELVDEIDDIAFDLTPFIAPDEEYIIFSSARSGGYGSFDLYISFKQIDGILGEPINMGTTINTPYKEAWPYVSPDGLYFFFVSIDGEDAGNPFWLDAQIIENYRD